MGEESKQIIPCGESCTDEYTASLYAVKKILSKYGIDSIFLTTNILNTILKKYKIQCSEEGCLDSSRSNGLCQKHYNAQYYKKRKEMIR